MKKIILFLAALYTFGAYAQSSRPVDLLINSEDGVYQKGDSVLVWAQLKEAQDLEFTITANEIEEIEKKSLSLKAGKTLVYADVINEPVHLMFALGRASEKKQLGRVGLIVAPQDMKPGYEVPADLREFWDEQIGRVRQTPLEAVVEKVDSGDPGYECFALTIPMHEGRPATGYVAYPGKAPEKSLPIVIFVHSAGVNKPGNRSNVEKALEDAKRGAIAIDINAHGFELGQPQEYYDALANGELKGYFGKAFKGHEDFYFRLMYLRLVRAVDYLVTMPQWDGKRILVYGTSQGGGQAGALAGIDSRIGASVMRVPAMTDIGGCLDNGRKGNCPTQYQKRATGEKEKSIIPYYDVASLLTLTDARLMVEAGLVDTTCPPSCVAAGYNNAASKDKSILFFPYRPHSSKSTIHKNDWKANVDDVIENFIAEYLK